MATRRRIKKRNGGTRNKNRRKEFRKKGGGRFSRTKKDTVPEMTQEDTFPEVIKKAYDEIDHLTDGIDALQHKFQMTQEDIIKYDKLLESKHVLPKQIYALQTKYNMTMTKNDIKAYDKLLERKNVLIDYINEH